MTRGPKGIAMALVLALLVGGPLAPLAAAPQTQPAASAEPNQDASSMPSATMEQDQAQQPQGQAPQQDQVQQPAPEPLQAQPDQPQQLGVGQSQPPAQETPGVVTPPPVETATPPAPPAPAPTAQTPVRASQPDQFKETVKSTSRPARRGSDGYDAAAVVVNIGRPPLKAVLCGLGVLGSATLFALTFGSASRAATAAVAEGCGGKWFVNGDDLRPEDGRAGSFEWETHQFDWEKR